MEFFDLILRVGAALGIGLLIGLERGWRTRADAPGTRTAGIRTFALAGLLGGIFGALAQRLEAGGGAGLLLGLGFLTFGFVFATFSRDENKAENTFSVTTAVAGMTTFALGAYALIGDVRLAAAGGVATAAVLALRAGLHEWVARITQGELRAGLVLLAMTFIALPLLPDRDVGPFGGINPQEVWFIAVVLAAVSFLGYIGVRVMGETSGVLFAAAAGGLVSSTAVMANNARQAHAGEGVPRVLAAGAILATAVSIARTMVVVGVLNSALLANAAAPLAAAAIAAAAAAILLAWRPGAEPQQAKQPLGNPFNLRAVLILAAFLGAMELVSRVLAERYGAAGVIVAALAAGAGDVDAVTVSITRLAPATVSVEYATWAVLAAVASNTLSKLGIGIAVGRGWFALAITGATVAVFAAGALGWALSRWFGMGG